jgi:hypothetical protein
MNSEITDSKLDRYFSITSKALDKVKIVKEGKINFEKSALDFLDMAQRYYKDANFFKHKGEIVNAFACLNYAHGWLDAGARLGLFDVNHDNQLFTID